MTPANAGLRDALQRAHDGAKAEYEGAPLSRVRRFHEGRVSAYAHALEELDRTTRKCGCNCKCHAEEATAEWPGPCAACCEPGTPCDCGRRLTTPSLLELPERNG